MSFATTVKITRILLLITPVIWLIWDIIAAATYHDPATESANIFYYGTLYPSIPMFWGLLTGHFFAEKRLPSTEAAPGGVGFIHRWSSWAVLICTVSWLVWDLLKYPSWLTRLVQMIPGPGHGSIEMVIAGTYLGYRYFQMDLNTLPVNK